MKLYRNAQTGETTESHKDAMTWYRGGATVEIPDFTNGKYKNRTPKNDNIYDIR